MKLIIGGAYQGKRKFAKNTYHSYDGWIDGKTCSVQELTVCRGIDHFHEFVKRLIQGEFEEELTAGSDIPVHFSMADLSGLEEQADVFAKWLYQRNPQIQIVTNELGYGVVPIERSDRMWREAVGRICTALAAQADEVVRVVCGVGMRLK